MEEVSIIGLDLAKNVFQAHGAAADGAVVFRRKLTRAQLLSFMADQPRCVVAMDACASAHHWGRAISDMGHKVRLIPPTYVKPFVKRQKNDMAGRPSKDGTASSTTSSQPRTSLLASRTNLRGSNRVVTKYQTGNLGHRRAPF